ncbi:MAG: hypothetical protein KJ774_11485 [Firmicutes bacterium]|jgi:hypothetical protein|nr:hypothetical protein [Bacillota bacterium]
MHVTKITDDQPIPVFTIKRFTKEELQREYDYYLAQKILESMLAEGLITRDEFNQTTVLNRRTFLPYLAEIMP